MNDEVYLNLWSAVLDQAIEDVLKFRGSFLAERTLSWFEDECKEVGSFHWICRILDLNPESVKNSIYQLIRESNSIAANNSPMELQAH